MKEDRIGVVEMMTSNVDLKEEDRPWRRSKAAARVCILERRVYLDERLVTHTEVSVPRGNHIIKVWDTHHEGYEILEVWDAVRM